MLNPPSTEHRVGTFAPTDAGDLRVAIVSDAAPERNGVGAYYRDLADHLKANGARVELVAPRYRAGHWHGGCPLPLPGDSTQRILIPSWSMVSNRLNRLHPNVVVVPTPGPYGMLGMHLAGRLGIDLIVGFHTHFEALTNLFKDWGLRARIANAYLRGCHRLLFSKSHLVLANSTEMMEVARGIGAQRVSLMATSIPKRFLDRAPLPTNPDFKRILFAGRFAPEENLDAIVEAARRLPELEFLMAGDGPLRGWLQTQSRDLPNLTLIGWVRRARILALIDSVDALVLPSRVESFGTIALEAMARARPVLVSSACGIMSWDILNRGIFPIREDEHLSDTLMRVRASRSGHSAAQGGSRPHSGRSRSTSATWRIGWPVLGGDLRAHRRCSTLNTIRALVSVHDVMPETLQQVGRILARLEADRISTATLLVVPGAGWTPAGIAMLHRFQERGYELAGHGWRHRVDRIDRLSHRLHARLISRNVAEHLALDAAGIIDLMGRCHAWFQEHGLRAPTLMCRLPGQWALSSAMHWPSCLLPRRTLRGFSLVRPADSIRFRYWAMRRIRLSGHRSCASGTASAAVAPDPWAGYASASTRMIWI